VDLEKQHPQEEENHTAEQTSDESFSLGTQILKCAQLQEPRSISVAEAQVLVRKLQGVANYLV